jgi:hypothetical protein
VVGLAEMLGVDWVPLPTVMGAHVADPFMPLTVSP